MGFIQFPLWISPYQICWLQTKKPQAVKHSLQPTEHNVGAFSDADINVSINSCVICQMALGTAGLDSEISAR
jgi:hypothetical protein